MHIDLSRDCAVPGCPSPRHTSVVLRVEGVFRTVDVCRRHAGAYVAAREAAVGR